MLLYEGRSIDISAFCICLNNSIHFNAASRSFLVLLGVWFPAGIQSYKFECLNKYIMISIYHVTRKISILSFVVSGLRGYL